MKIVLASKSQRRRKLLKDAGYEVTVVEPEASEEILKGERDPHKITILLARRKAESVCKKAKKGIVLGADTVTFYNGEVIGKPTDENDAVRILKKLSGTTHRVITGICIVDAKSGKTLCGSAQTTVTMKNVSEEDILRYVKSGESAGACGAYKVQERGDQFIEEIRGSYTNVVGLPLELLTDMLGRFERCNH
jgi:septum formation protein